MRCFYVSEDKIIPALSVVSLPYPHIGIGEEGRGRRYFRFPLAKSFAESLLFQKPCPERNKWGIFLERDSENRCRVCGTKAVKIEGVTRHPEDGFISAYQEITRGSIIKTREKGTLLLVEEKDPTDRRALVLVNISAGYRGDTEWTSAEKRPCPNRGKKFEWGWKCSICDTILDDAKNHPNEGWEYFPFPSKGINVLAEGYCAQGDAGRMGGHVVRLLIMEPGAIFRVRRLGRLYGAPAERYVFWDGVNLRLGTLDEVYLPTEEVEEGEMI